MRTRRDRNHRAESDRPDSAAPLRADAAKAKASSRAFTLIELLVVVSIMILILAAGTPALLKSFRSSNLTNAGNRVVDLAALARQLALSHNSMTALLLVTNHPSDAALSNRALTIVERQSDQSWKQTIPWVILPSEIRAYDGSPTPLPGDPPQLTLTGTAAGGWSAFTFNPDGSLYGSDSNRNAYIRFLSDGRPSQLADPGVKNYYDLVFSPDTGSAHVVRR